MKVPICQKCKFAWNIIDGVLQPDCNCEDEMICECGKALDSNNKCNCKDKEKGCDICKDNTNDKPDNKYCMTYECRNCKRHLYYTKDFMKIAKGEHPWKGEMKVEERILTEDGRFCNVCKAKTYVDQNNEVVFKCGCDKEKVDHPDHYNKGKIEVIDFIEDQKLGFALGNAIKYICRAEHKENNIEDIKKAVWYLERKLNDLA